MGVVDNEIVAAEAAAWQRFAGVFIDCMIADGVRFADGYYWIGNYSMTRDSMRKATGEAASGASLPESRTANASRVREIRVDGIEKCLAAAAFAKAPPSDADPKSIERTQMRAGAMA